MSKNIIDETPSKVATAALTAIPFGSIIGGPLKACVDAQAEAAESTWKFIRDVGLQDDETGKKKAVTVKFEYMQGGRAMMLIVPLLTIVPIPYIAIDTIDINFKAQISASATTSETESKSSEFDTGIKGSAGYRGLFSRAKVSMHANFSSKKDSKATQESKYSVEYTMDVHVHAGQDSMPAGMAKVLEILNNAVDTVNSKGELSVSQNTVKKGVPVFVSYRDDSGKWAPREIGWTENKDSGEVNKLKDDENQNNNMQLTQDEEAMLLKFDQVGDYTIKAGQCRANINVVD